MVRDLPIAEAGADVPCPPLRPEAHESAQSGGEAKAQLLDQPATRSPSQGPARADALDHRIHATDSGSPRPDHSPSAGPATEEEARLTARRLLGRTSVDPERPWELIEFLQGWLISEEPGDEKPRLAGGFSMVVERQSGRVLRFPSFIPPDRILNEYEAVVGKARVQGE